MNFPLARSNKNLRGREIMELPEAKAAVARGVKHFSVSIYEGKGEVFIKLIDGVWQESVVSVDYCFGTIKGKWHKF